MSQIEIQIWPNTNPLLSVHQQCSLECTLKCFLWMQLKLKSGSNTNLVKAVPSYFQIPTPPKNDKGSPQKKIRDYLGIFPNMGGVFPIPKTFVN